MLPAQKCFSLHPLLITAAHSGVSFPWITAQSATSKHLSVYSTYYSTRFFYHSMAHRRTWLAFRFCFGMRRCRPLLCSVLSLMCSFCSGALGGGEEQGRQWTFRSTTINKDRAAMWWWVYGVSKKGQLWCWTSSTALWLKILREWAGGWWIWQKRWRRASVRL